MKTYITENQVNEITSVLEQLITSEHLTKIKELKKKYDIDFVYDRRTNMNLFFMKMVNEIDAIPNTNDWKKNLNRYNLFWNTSDHSKGVTIECQPTVINFMHLKGYIEDYNYIQNYNTRELENYLGNFIRTYKIPNVKVNEVIEIAPNFKKYFSQFTKKFADKQAIDYTSKIISIIESMYKDEILTVEFVKPFYIDAIRKGKSKDEIFDQIHNTIN